MRLVILASLLFFGFAKASWAEFTLRGQDNQGEECFLYVDNYGQKPTDALKNTFFAEVRTSDAPDRSILLIAHPAFRNGMVSVDQEGRLTRAMRMNLRGPPIRSVPLPEIFAFRPDTLAYFFAGSVS